VDAFEDDLVYYTVAELLGEVPADFWELGGDYLTAYGQSIGSRSGIGASTKVIDLTSRTLTGGLWNADNGISALKGTADEAGYFKNGDFIASFANDAAAGSLEYTGITVELCSFTYNAAVRTEGNIDVTSGDYYHTGTQVVSTQGAAVADATDAASAITQLNALLARLRASTGHGLIA